MSDREPVKLNWSAADSGAAAALQVIANSAGAQS
jgi:hypothetical protein